MFKLPKYFYTHRNLPELPKGVQFAGFAFACTGLHAISALSLLRSSPRFDDFANSIISVLCMGMLLGLVCHSETEMNLLPKNMVVVGWFAQGFRFLLIVFYSLVLFNSDYYKLIFPNHLNKIWQIYSLVLPATVFGALEVFFCQRYGNIKPSEKDVNNKEEHETNSTQEQPL